MRLFLFCFFMCVAPTAYADYFATETGVTRSAEAIIDATVVRFDDKGHAHLEVHSAWIGVAPKTVKSVRLTCLMGSARDAGLKVGQRYIIMVDEKDNLYEEKSYYEVADGKVKATDLTGEYLPRGWMPLADFRHAIERIRSTPHK